MSNTDDSIQIETNTNTNTNTNTELWSDDYEKICDSIRQNSVLLGNYHKKRYLYLKYILQFFRIPVIILSGVNSVISVGIQNFVQQQTISVITCVISFICSIIGSIELYLQIQTQMDNELNMSKEFYMLSIEIYKCLSLNRNHRLLDGKSFLEEKFGIYEKLIEASGVINQKLNDKLTPLPAKLKNIPIIPSLPTLPPTPTNILSFGNVNDIQNNRDTSNSSLIPLSFSLLSSFSSFEPHEEDKSEISHDSNV
jgi:hypothetical protein